MKTYLRNSLLILAMVSLVVPRVFAAALGVMGDSLSDEYFEPTTAYGGYATNWAPLLVQKRGVNMGAKAVSTWGEPRRTGYAYNWARSSSTSADLLSQGQHTGLAAQVGPAGVTHAVLAIGANDFHPLEGAYFNIYNGFWSSSQIDNYVNQVITNVAAALDVLQPTGVKLVLFNALDYGKTPAVYNSILYFNASNRERVSTAIRRVNDGIAYLAQKVQAPLIDAFGLQEAIFGPHDSHNQFLYVGNVAVKLLEGDTDPVSNPDRSAAFVEDEAHPHTVLQGLFANMVLKAFELGYHVSAPLFTEAELLNNANLAYGGSDTLTGQLGAYDDYIILPIISRATTMAMAGGDVQFQFDSASNQLYRVEVCDDLVVGTWTELTNVVGTGNAVTIIDTNAPVSGQRFYSVIQLP